MPPRAGICWAKASQHLQGEVPQGLGDLGCLGAPIRGTWRRGLGSAWAGSWSRQSTHGCRPCGLSFQLLVPAFLAPQHHPRGAPRVKLSCIQGHALARNYTFIGTRCCRRLNWDWELYFRAHPNYSRRDKARCRAAPALH